MSLIFLKFSFCLCGSECVYRVTALEEKWNVGYVLQNQAVNLNDSNP